MLSVMKLAWRNTRRHFRRSAFLAGAIAFGVMVITLLNAFAIGVSGNIKQNLSDLVGGHLFIGGFRVTDTGREVGIITDGTAIEKVVVDGGLPVQSIHRRSRAIATLIFGTRRASELIDGVDFRVEMPLLQRLPLQSSNFDLLPGEERSIFVTGLTARKLGVEVGETVLARLTTVTGQTNVGEFVVAGIIDDRASLGMSFAYASLSHLNSLIGLEPNQFQLLTVVLKHLHDVDAGAEKIYDLGVAEGLDMERPELQVATQGTQTTIDISALLGQASGSRVQDPWEGTRYRLTTINEMMAPLEAAFTVLNSIGTIIFVVLLLITMVGILNTFRMILVERTREIGTIRALGMQRTMVRWLFLWEAAFISLGGGCVGVGLAAVISHLVGRISFAHVTELQFLTAGGHFTFHFTAGALVTNIGILLAMSLTAALLPADAASKMEPAKALRAYF